MLNFDRSIVKHGSQNIRATVGDILFYRSQTGSSNNLARLSDNNVIQNLKLGSLSGQQHLFRSGNGQYIFYD